MTEPRSANYRALLRDREVRTLLVGTLVSLAGDQLARLALSVLVFRRTDSALLTGLTYALTFLPALVGGPLLAGLADRLPRRRVMIAADLIRVPLVALLAIPGLPLPVAFLILSAVTVVESPFDAARAAMLPDIVAGEQYQRALALDRGVQQSAQVVGFALGGLLVTVLDPSTALLLDAASFAVSAALLRHGLRERPAPVTSGTPAHAAPRVIARRAWQDARTGAGIVLGDRPVRRIILLVWLTSAVAIVPEGLAVPYAGSLAAGGLGIGLLLAANPVGNALAGPFAARITSATRASRLVPLALLVTVPLMGCALAPPLAAVIGIVALSGMGMTMSLLGRAEFVARVPADKRGRAFALAAAGITVVQGVAVAAAGAAADVTSPATVVAAAGCLGCLGTAVITLTHRRRVEQPHVAHAPVVNAPVVPAPRAVATPIGELSWAVPD